LGAARRRADGRHAGGDHHRLGARAPLQLGLHAEDPDQPRFFAYLSLFTFAMLMLVTADNLVQMFFGWEGVA
jgi:formate hydrogenlyase subunit 3/multisubunit Na+/H+ antiporter MnhD subunit